MEQAPINLITNGITYSEQKNSITAAAQPDPHSPENRIIISVEDSGIGIAKDYLERLFERFYRCDKGRGKEQGCTGPGLSIVKHIAMAHGGSVAVESQVGKGTTSSIFLPV